MSLVRASTKDINRKLMNQKYQITEIKSLPAMKSANSSTFLLIL